MKFAVKRLLDSGSVVGYKTVGLKPELYIDMFIEEETAEIIFEKVAALKEVPDEIPDIASVVIRTRVMEDGIHLLLPDEDGNYE